MAGFSGIRRRHPRSLTTGVILFFRYSNSGSALAENASGIESGDFGDFASFVHHMKQLAEVGMNRKHYELVAS
jgi:hypothetical protein